MFSMSVGAEQAPFGADVLRLLREHTLNVIAAYRDRTFNACLGACRFGETFSFQAFQAWAESRQTATVRPFGGYQCQAPQCNGGQWVDAWDVGAARRWLRRSIGTPDGRDAMSVKLQTKLLRVVAEIVGDRPFSPKGWPGLSTSDQNVEIQYARLEQQLETLLAECRFDFWMGMMMVASLEDVMCGLATFGTEEHIQALEKASKRIASIQSPALRRLFQSGVKHELYYGLGGYKDLLRFYQNGNPLLGRNDEGTLLLLCRDFSPKR